MKIFIVASAVILLGCTACYGSFLINFDPTSSYLAETVIEFASNATQDACKIFANTVRQFPLKVPNIDRVSFQLRTPCEQLEFPIKDVGKLRQSPQFDVNKKTVVFISGWIVEPDKEYIEDLAQAYHCRGDHNFVFANTGGYITNLYINSAYISTRLGQFIAIGLRNLGITPKSLHLIGHSLGAHIAGSAGRYYQRITGRRLPRITGLDPARTCFLTPVVFPRLGRGDADFVDIIHSNPGEFGLEEVLGDADFYAGGLNIIKPGCGKTPLLCSHERSIRYYTESVYPYRERNFLSVQCRNKVEMEYKQCTGSRAFMGYKTRSNVRGVFFSEVAKTPPYGRNAKNDDAYVPYYCTRCMLY